MSANENLFRATKHINTFNKDVKGIVIMNIFEIIALKEADVPTGAVVQASPGVNASLYRVTYPPELDKLPDLVQGEERARQKYSDTVDEWNATSKQRQKEERKKNKAEAKRRKLRAKELDALTKEVVANPNGPKATKLFSHSRGLVKRSMFGAGIVGAGAFEDQTLRAFKTYIDNKANLSDTENVDFLERQLDGIMAAQLTLLGPQILSLIVTAVKGGYSAVKGLVTGIRAINLATTAAMAATVVGAIPGLIKWIAVEGALWAVIYLVMKSESAQKALSQIITEYYVGRMHTDLINSGFQGLSSFVDLANRATIDNATVSKVTGDLKKTMGMTQDEVQKAFKDEPGTINKSPDAKDPSGPPDMSQFKNNGVEVDITDPSHPNNQGWN